MITALDDDESIDRAFSAGAVDLIRKPIQWPVLRNRIKYIINAYHARREIEGITRNYEMILDARITSYNVCYTKLLRVPF